jgi:hypothetical protein
MKAVTTEQALETYTTTVRDYDRPTWATWVVAVSNSLAAGEWLGGDMFPAFAKEVFEALSGVKKVSMADEKDRP